MYLNEHNRGAKTATVVVPEDQLSLAIGRDGQNARLAAKLTAWKIDIKSLPEAAGDAMYKLQNDPDFAQISEHEGGVIPQVEAVLAKKAEGRPVTPEEYHLLTQFVDRVERGLIRQREEEQHEEEEQQRKARANVPAGAFDIPLEKFEISDRVYAVISETGLQTVGDLMLQMELDPDSIWRLSGMGPKAMQELKNALAKVREQLQAEAEEAAEPAEEVVEAAPVEEGQPELSEAVVTSDIEEMKPELAAEAEPQGVVEETEAVCRCSCGSCCAGRRQR